MKRFLLTLTVLFSAIFSLVAKPVPTDFGEKVHIGLIGQNAPVLHQVDESTSVELHWVTQDNYLYDAIGSPVAPKNGFNRPAQSVIDDAVAGLDPTDARLVRNTVDAIYENRAWNWSEIGDAVADGARNVGNKRSAIRKIIKDNGLVPDIKFNGKFAGFDDFALHDTYLIKSLWNSSDAIQFGRLNKAIGGKVNGYTWHHHQDLGRMQLIPMGLHRFYSHHGGKKIWGGGR